MAVVGDVNSLLVNWQNVAVNLAGLLLAIDRFGARDEFRRIDHVANTAWMNDAAGRWQLPHKKPGTASMIKVYVRQEDVVNVVGVKALLLECVQQ